MHTLVLHTCIMFQCSFLYSIHRIFFSCRAAALGHFEAIQTLSAYGADFTLATTLGENAMHFATRNIRLLCLRLLGQRGECVYCAMCNPYM